MAIKVFCTGTTGYIGGDALFAIVHAHPEWEITCLARSPEKGALITGSYPKIRIVYGDLDSVDLLEEEAKSASIVFHFADCDHEPSALALARGLSQHTPESPGYWIHTSGTGILTYPDFPNNLFGQESHETFDDWDNIDKVLSIPDHARHRLVDKTVIKAGSALADRVKTAIICPPTIYGPGRGPGKTRGAQAYNLAREILRLKQGFLIGRGENMWTQVHVFDLSQLYLMLGEHAAQGGGRASWGIHGYYFANNGEFAWGDVARAITQDAYSKRLIPSPTLKSLTRTLDAQRTALAPSPHLEALSPLEEDKISPFLHYVAGSNSRSRAVRATELLGWVPREKTLIEEVPAIVDYEAKSLGLV
ncbi:hypothetical protein BJX64DRAFT_149616 [Aspergillus heterothallicus]